MSRPAPHRKPFVPSEKPSSYPPDWRLVQMKLLKALLADDDRQALDIAALISNRQELLDFYHNAIQPAMYEVGRMWESGEVSVAQEHRASARVGRIMASLHAAFISSDGTTGRAVVAAVTNEHHEMGAWIVSDSLELDNWDVHYLGANPSREELVKLVMSDQPDLVALSVTISSNITQVRDIISDIRSNPQLKNIPILAGGLALNQSPDSWKTIGADAYAPDALSAVRVARNLLEHHKRSPQTHGHST